MQWKWATVKPGGYRPQPRSGVNVVVAPNGKAYIFGGVLDINEDEENLDGSYSNEMHMLELNTSTWRLIELKGKKDGQSSKTKEIDDAEMDMAAAAATATSQGFYFSSLWI